MLFTKGLYISTLSAPSASIMLFVSKNDKPWFAMNAENIFYNYHINILSTAEIWHFLNTLSSFLKVDYTRS